jgi:Flp pilus assembly CpaF family ATPase
METMDPDIVFGPIAELMSDPTVEEIWINSPQRIFVARNGKSQLINLVLTSDSVRQLIYRNHSLMLDYLMEVDCTLQFLKLLLSTGR